jgi:GT2 family glycosyltransferase
MSTGKPTNTLEVRFSIIIPHRNGEEVILRTLHALANVTTGDDEIIVVDNASNDHSTSSIRKAFRSVRIIENRHNVGFAKACNQGLRIARGRYLLLLNNDAVLGKGVLERFAWALERRPRPGVVGGQLVDNAGNVLRSHRAFPTIRSECGFSSTSPTPQHTGSELVEVEQVAGVCMAIHREVLEKVGLLDERFFFYFEDTEFCLRLRRMGFSVLLDPKARITHDLSANQTRRSREAQLEYLRSRLFYYKIAFPPGVRIVVTVYRVLRICLYFVKSLLYVILTLGCNNKARMQLVRYGYLLGWLMCGCPKHWGLPGKEKC